MKLEKLKKIIAKELEKKDTNVLTVFSPSNFYQPSEEIVFIVISLFVPKEPLKITLTAGEILLEERELSLSKEGFAIVRFSGVPVGRYKALVGYSNIEENSFFDLSEEVNVVEYSTSLLVSEIVNKVVENDQIRYDVQVKRPDGSLYTGDLKIEEGIITFQTECKDGNLTFWTPSDYLEHLIKEGFSTSLTLKDEFGNSSFLNLYPLEKEKKSQIEIPSFDLKHTLSIHPDSDTKALGLYFIESESWHYKEYLWKLITPIVSFAENPKIKIRLPNQIFKKLLIANFSMDGKEWDLREFKNTKPLEILEIPAYQPINFLYYIKPGENTIHNKAVTLSSDSLNLEIEHEHNILFGNALSLKIQSGIEIEAIIVLKKKFVEGTSLQEGLIQNLDLTIKELNKRFHTIIRNILMDFIEKANKYASIRTSVINIVEKFFSKTLVY